mgnify:CR=1 FL=1
MTYPTSWENAKRLRKALLLFLTLALGLLVLTLLDKHLWNLLLLDPDKSLERKDWWQVLRQIGSIFPWLIVAALLILLDRSRAHSFTNPYSAPTLRKSAWHRGLMVLLATAISGGLAEGLKGLVRRARPLETGEYRFAWIEPGIHLPGGLASSHTAVAFAGAIMLSWFIPVWRVPLILLALCCSMTRVIVGAHFVTDVYIGILLAWGTCAVLWKFFCKNPGGSNHPTASWMHLRDAERNTSQR